MIPLVTLKYKVVYICKKNIKRDITKIYILNN